jgi:hypothetical protein
VVDDPAPVVPESRPLVSAADAPRAAPPPPVAAAAPSRSRRELVEDTLTAYRNALGSLDAKAVQVVYPSADVKGMAKNFDQFREQSLRLENCRIETNATTAKATCSGTIRFVPKQGNRSERTMPMEFNLRANDEAWVIDRIVTR